MSEETVSKQAVIDAIDGESRLEQSERCRLFVNLFRNTDDWSEEAYLEMGSRGCREYPLEATPTL